MLIARKPAAVLVMIVVAAGMSPIAAHGMLAKMVRDGCVELGPGDIRCRNEEAGSPGTPGTTTVYQLSEEELKRIRDIERYCQHEEKEDAVRQRAGLLSELAGNSKYQGYCSPAARSPGDPATAARQVVAGMQLRPPRIGIVPPPGPDSLGLVGQNSWMWVDRPDPQTFGPITDTATLGAWTINVTATVESVDWDMGDGQVVHCAGPGTPYQDSYGFDPSPDCGHVYTQQGVYTVTATAHWRVEWTSTDQTGTLTTDQTATAQIAIGELQVLVKRGKER